MANSLLTPPEGWSISPNDGNHLWSINNDGSVSVFFEPNKGDFDNGLIKTYRVSYNDGKCSTSTEVFVDYCKNGGLTPDPDTGGTINPKCTGGCVEVYVTLQSNGVHLNAIVHVSKTNDSLPNPGGLGIVLTNHHNGLEHYGYFYLSEVYDGAQNQIADLIGSEEDRVDQVGPNSRVLYVGMRDTTGSVENKTNDILSEMIGFCTARTVDNVCFFTQSSVLPRCFD